MVIYLLDLYSITIKIKYTIIKELMEMKDFQFIYHQVLIQKAEKICYGLSCSIVFTCLMTLFLLHPVTGGYQNFPTTFLLKNNANYKVMVYILLLVEGLMLVYAQLIPVCAIMCLGWTGYILHIGLLEYIETNLCRPYEHFNVIESEQEQELIGFHLKQCTKFHRLLRK